MKRLIVTGATGLILFAVSASAQSQSPTTAQTDTAAAPVLITTTQVKQADSALVRAAKQTAASRKKKAATKIDNETLKHASGSRMTEPTQPLPPIVSPATSAPITTPPMRVGAPDGPDRASLEQRLDTLKKQQTRLAAAADDGDPYGGDEGDAAAKRLSNVNDEIKKLEKQLAESPKKP